jgi:hypothetical protein
MKTEYQELIKKLSLYIALKSDIIYNAAQTKQNSESEGGGVKEGKSNPKMGSNEKHRQVPAINCQARKKQP